MLSESFLFIVRQSTYCFCTDLFISISVEFGSTSKREAFLLSEKDIMLSEKDTFSQTKTRQTTNQKPKTQFWKR